MMNPEPSPMVGDGCGMSKGTPKRLKNSKNGSFSAPGGKLCAPLLLPSVSGARTVLTFTTAGPTRSTNAEKSGSARVGGATAGAAWATGLAFACVTPENSLPEQAASATAITHAY